MGEVEPRLYRALVATFGPADGREATVDALSWAWEHWSRLREVDNKLGYLYRVGQSAVRRFGSRPVPVRLLQAVESRIPEITPELVPALAKLPTQQRTVVVLVHAFGWSQAEVADLLGVSASTVHEHLSRAVERLRAELEVVDDR
ncbi:MAG: sigma-70 family RNA polymerase sigma factor [Ilumatobacteraceae bacterium]